MTVDLTQYGINTDGQKVHEELIYTTALIYNVLNSEISSQLAPYDLSPGKLNVLVAIKYHGGATGLPQVRIGRHLILTKSNMTKHLDNLEKDGLITRSPCLADRRVKLVKITPKAERLLDKLWRGYNLRLEQLTEGMSPGRQQQLAALLTDWFESLVQGGRT